MSDRRILHRDAAAAAPPLTTTLLDTDELGRTLPQHARLHPERGRLGALAFGARTLERRALRELAATSSMSRRSEKATS
jgi:hypothetical protein